MKVDDLRVGSKLKMKVPNSFIPSVLCHIEAIITDPQDTTNECKMIVFRYWSKYKKGWIWKILPYWELGIYNKWNTE